VATRYDKLARNFFSNVALATLLAYWHCTSLESITKSLRPQTHA
jgi:hypothetical protein